MNKAAELILSVTCWLMLSLTAAPATELGPAEALVLGPLPPAPVAAEERPLGIGSVPLHELDPAADLPAAGDAVALAPGLTRNWTVQPASDGGYRFGEPGVFWLTAHLDLDRWAEVTLTVESEAATVIFAGAEESEESELEVTLGRGRHRISLRVEVGGEMELPAAASLRATVPEGVAVGWSLEGRRAPTDFDRTRRLGRLGPLAVAPEGKLIARRYTRREKEGDGTRRSLDVLDDRGDLVAADLGGPAARPIRFTADGRKLLIARGEDLLLWTAPAGPMRRLLHEEPGLGLTRLSPDGSLLLFASTRGAEREEAEEGEARRRRELRERVSDFTPEPHLHLMDLASGARRRLTLPGDHVLDDAAFLPDGRRVVYGRTVARAERPWFESELRIIDLASGKDELLTSFVAGWEVRPQVLTPHPKGRLVAFIGAPGEVGGGRAERNVYNKQVWLLDLEARTFRRITRDLPWTFDNGMAWDSSGHGLLIGAHRGSRSQLVHVVPEGNSWRLRELETAGESAGAVAIAPDGSAIAYTASDPVTPARLYLHKAPERDSSRSSELAAPDAELTTDWILATPRDLAVTGPDGDAIEAWYYLPSVQVDEGPAPLIVYYYGGSSPTGRGFNTTHQFLAANGYAVLVVNPRGASGYGDAFADHHAGDWGPKASADILAAVDALLERKEKVDGSRMGCYGGSYGGFMTEYLIATSDRFGAAVSMYGIADLATYWGQGDWGWTYGDMANAGATPWADPDLFAQSPLWHADRITTPLLLLHGTDDTNVTPGQSEELFTALRVQDKPVELVLFPDEGHGISGTFTNRADHRNMMLWWFDKWLRDQPGAWEARWAE